MGGGKAGRKAGTLTEGSVWLSALGGSVLTVDTEKYPSYVAWCRKAHGKSRMSLLWMR